MALLAGEQAAGGGRDYIQRSGTLPLAPGRKEERKEGCIHITVCVHIYICIYIYRHIHMYLYTLIRLYVYMLMRIYTFMHITVPTNRCIPT